MSKALLPFPTLSLSLPRGVTSVAGVRVTPKFRYLQLQTRCSLAQETLNRIFHNFYYFLLAATGCQSAMPHCHATHTSLPLRQTVFCIFRSTMFFPSFFLIFQIFCLWRVRKMPAHPFYSQPHWKFLHTLLFFFSPLALPLFSVRDMLIRCSFCVCEFLPLAFMHRITLKFRFRFSFWLIRLWVSLTR